MPYTYDDFRRAADAAGLSDSFDESDLTIAQRYPEFGLSLVSLKRDLGNAQTAEQRLLVNEAMNQLRKNYGSYGVGEPGNRSYATSYGSKIDQALDKIGSFGDYQSAYSDQISKAIGDIGSYGDFKSSYGNQISKALEDIKGYGDFQYSKSGDYQELLDRIINQGSFQYDPTTDPIFSSYKKAYNREGDRAAANALAAAAAATGGRASSYANMAAQQANNYYAGKLADIIPTLRNQALDEYNNAYEQLLRQLSTVAGDRSTEYQQYLDRLTQMQQNLQNLQGAEATEYQQYLDRLTQMQQNLQILQGQDETEYGRYNDQLARMQQELEDLRTQDQTDYSRYLDLLNEEYTKERAAAQDRQNEFDNALKVYTATGQITGALADYLGGGSTYAGAAGTYTGGSGSSYNPGTYTGSKSGNELTAEEKKNMDEAGRIIAQYSYSKITGEPYRDESGKVFANIGSWEDYQRIKQLTGASDEQLAANGIRYGYPTTKDGNGNLMPALAPNGSTWEEYDAAGGNYQSMVERIQHLMNAGATKDEVLADIRDAYQNKVITPSDYQRLYNQYRNMDTSEFGSGFVPSTSGRATGKGTVQPGTRTPPTTTTPTATTQAPTTTGTTGGAVNSIVQAIQKAVQQAEADPYAGYNVDPVTNANFQAATPKGGATTHYSSSGREKGGSSGSFGNSSSGSSGSGATKPKATIETPSSTQASTPSTQLAAALQQALNEVKKAVETTVSKTTTGTAKTTTTTPAKKTTGTTTTPAKTTTTGSQLNKTTTPAKTTSTGNGGNNIAKRTLSKR